jgi:transposase
VTRVAVALSCSVEQRTELMNLARSRTAEARLVERAKIILACLDGKRNDEVSHELGVRPNTVGLWRKRFAARGMAGLRDQPRRGKKPRYGAELRLRILRQLELPPPPGLAGWDGSTLAAALGVSDAAVWRVLRQEGIQLRRHRSWCVSTDPQFAAKAADIIGLYLNPPETVNLFAALEVATGVIRGKTTQTKKRVDFQAFMSEIIADQPSDRQIHVILDNYCTHKKNETWLAAHPNVTFHFTPTSASWLNQVEIWFGIFTRKALSGASFRSAEQLKQAIHDFTAAYNQRAAPFVWRKREVKGSQLRHTIVNLRN